MEYINRTYRQQFGQERWHHFVAKYKETDLWVGVDRTSWQAGIEKFTQRYIRSLREEMDSWISKNPGYARALIPYIPSPDAPEIFREMARVAEKSGIGPMSAVAGAVAVKTGQAIREKFNVKEVIVENGGDIYADIAEDMDISVFAGSSPLSGKVGLHVEAESAPVGICTSSGTVGPSLSFGKADAVMIICRDAMLADTYATAFANCIHTAGDIPDCIGRIREKEKILAAVAIKDDKVGICGKFELKLF